MRGPLDGQMALDLFPAHAAGPTWDDVQKGRARTVDRIEPCDGAECMFWHGGCTHTDENYAFPKLQPDGKCRKHYLEWVA